MNRTNIIFICWTAINIGAMISLEAERHSYGSVKIEDLAPIFVLWATGTGLIFLVSWIVTKISQRRQIQKGGDK